MSKSGTGFSDMDAGHLMLFEFQKAVTFSICLFLDFLKPLKICCHIDNFYFHGGNQREKYENPKKRQKSEIHI